MKRNHEGCSRLFDQAIYTYLISCRVGSGFRVELSDQASQSDSSTRIQLLNPIRHFSKKIPIRPDTFRVEYSTRTRVLDPTRSIYICLAFANVVSQMKTSSQLSISILMMWFASIWRRCKSHHSFMFSCTSRTHMFDFDFIIKFSMHRLTVMSNLFDLQVKCVSSYFSEANVTSWV